MQKIDNQPIHPGVKFMDEVLKSDGVEPSVFAEKYELDVEELTKALSGKISLSAKMIASFAFHSATTGEYWLNMQANYDSWLTHNKLIEQDKELLNKLTGVKTDLRDLRSVMAIEADEVAKNNREMLEFLEETKELIHYFNDKCVTVEKRTSLDNLPNATILLTVIFVLKDLYKDNPEVVKGWHYMILDQPNGDQNLLLSNGNTLLCDVHSTNGSFPLSLYYTHRKDKRKANSGMMEINDLGGLEKGLLLLKELNDNGK